MKKKQVLQVPIRKLLSHQLKRISYLKLLKLKLVQMLVVVILIWQVQYGLVNRELMY